MKTNKILSVFAASVVMLVSGCSDTESLVEIENKVPIALAADYKTTSRVTDAGFADGDRMGVFITDYIDGIPQALSTSGNRANNVLFTYKESENRWNGATTIYWRDNSTSVDVVGYYPFDGQLTSVSQYPFAVQLNQAKEATSGIKGGYEASDFLWAKSTNIAPTKETIRLLYNHLLAGVTIRLVEKEGFAEGEWQKAVKQVWIENTVPNALINIEKGTVLVDEGETKPIIPMPNQNEYRAVVVPQSVAAGETLLGISIDGIDYKHTLKNDMVYTTGKMHTFTIEVVKHTPSGEYEFTMTSESVSAWVDDAEFHEGLLREYVVVHVEAPGTFKQCLEDKKLNHKAVTNLKVTGRVNWDDLRFMGQQMIALTHLNLYDVRIDNENDEEDDVITGFACQVDQTVTPLTRVILPSTLRAIGDQAFYRTSLSGTLEIPEGVTSIGYGAFIDCPFNAGVKFPSTLEVIGGDAFAWSGLTGELHFPEGLKAIGGGAFNGTKVYGSLNLPEGLEYFGGSWGCAFTGEVVFPQGTEIVGGLGGSQISHVVFPEGMKVIVAEMFQYTPLQGELLLPKTIEEINSYSFNETKISAVTLPEKLRILGEGAFANCSRLAGVIEIPKGIVVLPRNLFYQCSMLDGVRLHEDVVFIAKDAFYNCYNLSTLICDAVNPPVVETGAFDGVPKDQFSIEVPAKSVALYKQAEGWKDFKRITAYSDFVCRPATACALNNQHEETLILNANGGWRVIHQPDWCKLSQSSGNGKSSLRLIINSLEHGAASRRDSIVFALDNSEFTTYCTVQQNDYEYEEDVMVTLQKHTKGNGVDILFLGDGYDSEALANGDFLNLAKEQMEYFFAVPPYDRLRDYFNVYAGISLSQERGINTINSYYNTRFGTIYSEGKRTASCQSGAGARLLPDDEIIFPYVKETLVNSHFTDDNLRRTLIILLPNTVEYGGVSYLYDDGRAISICPKSEQAYPYDMRGVVQREAGGFGFGKLGDEVIKKHGFAPKAIRDEIDARHSMGWYQNLASTGKLDDVPWAHYVFDPRYSDYVDVYEGGYGFTRYIFRSEAQSCMSTSIPYYNTISRESITRRVMDYAGVSFDMEEFYANDTNAWGSTGMESRSATAEEYPSVSGVQSKSPVLVTSKYIPNKPKYNKK